MSSIYKAVYINKHNIDFVPITPDWEAAICLECPYPNRKCNGECSYYLSERKKQRREIREARIAEKTVKRKIGEN
nr:MAG TPA: hypothetical protein [Caudoviricetes sp.]